MNTQKDKKSGLSPVAVGIAGAAVVAGAVAAFALSKKENRDKVGEVARDLGEKGKSLAHQAESVVSALQKERKPLEKKVKTAAANFKKAKKRA